MLSKPNIVFIMADQLRHDFLSCYGADFISTPNIDRIAAGGVRYANAYSEHPLCVAARVSLLTGMNAIKTGVGANGAFLRPDYQDCGMQPWPETLAAAGYHTAAIGKMHFYPWDSSLGFDDRTIAEDKRWLVIQDDYYRFLAARGHRKYHGNEHEGYQENRGAIVSLLPWECYWDHFVGEQAADYLQRYQRDEPLAMMVGFPGPHCPYDPTPEYLKLFDEADMPAAAPEVEGQHPGLRRSCIASNKLPWNGVDYTDFTEPHIRKIRAHYAALVKQIDDEVGRILNALEQRDMLKDTVVLFASDHGDYLGDHGLIGKGTFFEGSTHVPLMALMPEGWDRLPGVAAGTVCDDLVTLTDITATLLEFGGCSRPDHMDARPLPTLGLQELPSRDVITGFLDGAWMAFDGRWKLAKYAHGKAMLFDLAEDPQEQRNLIDDGASARSYRHLDAALVDGMMASIPDSHRDKMVYVQDLSADGDFGRAGWQRTYPRSW
jgi:arylsulfatase